MTLNINVPDPLSLLPYQAGISGDGLKDEAAQGETSLDRRQKGLTIGEPIPIVFARRVTVGSSEVGGVFVAPGASSGSFINNSITNALIVNFQLVLTQGEVGDIATNAIYQRTCRVGGFKRSYGSRASAWTPLATITAVSGKTPWRNIPSYCGTDGVFDDLTVLSYTNTFDDGDTSWDRQIFVFIENGLKVTRILDSQVGSSNNFIDLAIYLIKQSNRLNNDLIDTTSMTASANFLETNSFLCNGVVDVSENLDDFLIKTGNQFLLRKSEKDGKICFKPRLPVNANHTINVNKITPVFGFNEDHILDGSFEIEYIPIAERQDALAIVIWRQQNDNEIGIMRTSEIKQTGVTNPVIIQYDLSKWCCSETHALKFGAFQIARKRYISHSLRIAVRPSTFNSTLALGDIVRVKLRRETNSGTVDYHDYLYEIERIVKETTGVIELSLIHFPVDSNQKSIVAQAVESVSPTNTVVATGRNDLTCHVNTSTTAILADPVTWTSGPGITGITLPTYEEDIPFEEDLGNPADPFESDIAVGLNDDRTDSEPLAVGDTLTATGGACAGGRVCYYRRPKTGPAVGEFVPDNIKEDIQCFSSDVGSGSYELTNADIDYIVGAEWSCPDPSTADGFGTPQLIGETANAIEPDFSDFDYVRWTGTKTKNIPGYTWSDETSMASSTETENYTSGWLTFTNYVGLNGSQHCAVVGVYNMDESSTDFSGRLYFQDGAITPWRSTVKELHTGTSAGGGSRRIGGLGVDTTQGPLCGSATEPQMSTGAPSSQGTTWTIEGKWEFSNDTGETKTVQATWGGRNPHTETDRWKIDSYQSAVDFGISDD